MALITYDDKSNSLPTSNPRRIFRDIDANEIKNVVNENAAALITREFNRAFSSELLFDKNVIEYEEHTLTGDVEFTIAASGHLSDQDTSILAEIVTDGSHSVTFTGFKYVLGDVQSGSIPDAGTYPVMFYHSNGRGIAIWGQPSSEVSNLSPLSAPGSFAAVPGSDPDSELDLSWAAVANASSYEIQYSVSGGSGPWIALTTPGSGDTTYTHSGLTEGTTYHYRIRAIGDLLSFANSGWSTTAATTEDSGDITAPTFVFSPADAATDVPMNGVVTITASAPLRDQDGVTVITDANVASYITAVNSSAAAQPFTATIDATKTIITVTPDVVWTELDDITITIDGVEGSINGVHAVADDATFTTNDYTLMNANYLNMGTQLDSFIVGADKNFELEAEYSDFLLVSGDRGLFQKNGAPAAQKSILATTNGNNVIFKFYRSDGSPREITWANALSGFTAGKITFKYFGAIDTNDGLDRVELYIDDVLISAGKTLSLSVGSWPFDIGSNSQPFYVSGPVFREVKNFIVRDNMGGTVQVNIPVIRTGEDISGNNRDGTWV